MTENEKKKKKTTKKKKTAKPKKPAGKSKTKSDSKTKKKAKKESIKEIPQPTTPPDNKVEEESAGVLAITSLILGICSIILCCGPLHLVLGAAAVVTGFLERNNIEQGESPEAGKYFALAGIITGTIGLFFFVLRVFGWFGLSALSLLENIVS